MSEKFANGLASDAATQRRREIAIRIALGARGVQTAAMIGLRRMGEAAGAAIGMVGAASAVIQAMLFNVSRQHPTAIAATAAFVVAWDRLRRPGP